MMLYSSKVVIYLEMTDNISSVVKLLYINLCVSILHSFNNSKLGRPEFMCVYVRVYGTPILDSSIVGLNRAPHLGFRAEFNHAQLELLAPLCFRLI